MKLMPLKMTFVLIVSFMALSAFAQNSSDPVPEPSHSSRILKNLKELSMNGTLGRNHLKLLVPLSSLQRPSHGIAQPNTAFYDTIDTVKFLHDNSFTQITEDAQKFFFGRDGMIVDDNTRQNLEDIKQQLVQSRLILRSQAGEDMNVPVQMLLLTIKKVKYVLISVPVNYLMRTLHYTGRVLKAGTMIVFAGPVFGTFHVGLLFAYAIKSVYSVASIGVWSLLYLAHEGLYIATNGKSSKSKVTDEIFENESSGTSCKSTVGK
jgi:hypothetical protein